MNDKAIKSQKVKKLTPRGERRRTEILEKALELFGEKGYRATTMEDIAKAANTGKGTVYWYWKSKEEIFLELLETKYKTYLELLERAIAAPLSVPEKMSLIIAEMGTTFSRYRNFCKLVFVVISDDTERFNKEALKITKNYYLEFRRIIAAVLEEGKREGSISSEADSESMATLMVSILDGLIVQERALQRAVSISEIGKALFAVLSGGLFVRSPAKDFYNKQTVNY